MPVINCKVELKLRWIKYCVLSVPDTDNVNGNDDDINFTIKDTTFYVLVVTLSTRINQKLLKLLSMDLKDQFIGMNIKQKMIIKIPQKNLDYFLESYFVGVNRLFLLVYSNEDVASKTFKSKKYYLPKGIINNYNTIIIGKNFYDQPIDSDIKRCEEITKSTTGLGEDNTTVSLLDYDYIKNH